MIDLSSLGLTMAELTNMLDEATYDSTNRAVTLDLSDARDGLEGMITVSGAGTDAALNQVNQFLDEGSFILG